MADLEREIGVELIDRKTYGKNRPVLSKAGEYFLEEMSYIASSYQNLVKRCQAIGRSGYRDVRIQELWQNNAMVELYSLAGAYQSDHLESGVRFVRLSDERPIDALLANKFDMVFDVWCGDYEKHVLELADVGVKAIHFLTENAYIWYQEGNPHIEGRRAVGLDELLTIPVVISRGNTWDYVASSYAAFCERERLAPRLRHVQLPDNSPTGMFMADFRDGVLMTTPAMAQDHRLRSRSNLKYLEVSDERIPISFLLAVRANDKESTLFLNYICSHMFRSSTLI